VTTFAPRTADEVTEAIRWVLSAGGSLEVLAGGSKRTLGRPVSAAHVLDVAALAGIVSYEPSELILTVRAGTPLRTIEAELGARSQCLAFEPPDLAPLLGTATAGTVGGAVATGLSGPRRFKAGAARDHVLGIAAVSGRGEAFVGGGKVVKNVTGYDIPKLMTGSYGTLAVLTEITLKVLPAPEHAHTALVTGLDIADAVRAMTAVLQSPADASGACHLPGGIVVPGKSAASAATAFRLEGFAPSVAYRLARVNEQLASLGTVSVLEGEESAAFWRAVRDAGPFVDPGFGTVWRISVPPAQAPAVAQRFQRALADVELFLDWGGGLIWLATRAHAEWVPAQVREALGDGTGHATLVRAPAILRSGVDVFQPQPAALAALSRRVKEQFDPARVLNPGRMYEGV
jgi:glycolate dehydrogenase FAD-binding subunit